MGRLINVLLVLLLIVWAIEIIHLNKTKYPIKNVSKIELQKPPITEGNLTSTPGIDTNEKNSTNAIPSEQVISRTKAVEVKKDDTDTEIKKSEITLPKDEVFNAQDQQTNKSIDKNTNQEQSTEFNSSFLRGGIGKVLDLTRFNKNQIMAPGIYDVDIYLNKKWVARHNILFNKLPGGNFSPCFNKETLTIIKFTDEILVKLEYFNKNECINLNDVVENATFSIDLASLSLYIGIPQIYLDKKPRGYVSPEEWQNGINALTSSYNFNYYHNTSGNISSATTNLLMTNGVDLEDWHLRNRSSYTNNSNGYSHFENISTYVQHDLKELKSQLTIGDSYTDGTIFNSLGFQGISIGTDDRMLPNSQRNFAPVVRGVAKTNALVQITQNGRKLYEATVPAGAFEFNDLYPTGYGGDLLVTIIEADGSKQTYTVPFSSSNKLVREGVWRYNIASGQVRDTQLNSNDKFIIPTIQYGFNNFITGYGGNITSDHYNSLLGGIALNSSLGALSLDYTAANANIIDGKSSSGRSFGIGYSKIFPSQTNVGISSYKHSSDNYWSFREALLARDLYANNVSPSLITHTKNLVQLSISQKLAQSLGNFFLSGTVAQYWNKSGRDNQYQIGYNNNFHIAGLNTSSSISYSHRLNQSINQDENILFATLSIPLNQNPLSPRATASFSDDKNNGVKNKVTLESLSGTIGDDHQFTYGINAAQNSGNNNYGLTGLYKSPYTALSGTLSKGNDYNQESFGLTGGVVLHSGGLTFTNQMGNTMALISAPGASGAKVIGTIGTYIDSSGYAIHPQLSPYQKNKVSLDAETANSEVEFKDTSAEVVPRANSIVLVKFDSDLGSHLIVGLNFPDQKPIPFGSSILNSKEEEIGNVGQKGKAVIRIADQDRKFHVKWGESPDQTCKFEIPKIRKTNDSKVELLCQ